MGRFVRIMFIILKLDMMDLIQWMNNGWCKVYDCEFWWLGQKERVICCGLVGDVFFYYLYFILGSYFMDVLLFLIFCLFFVGFFGLVLNDFVFFLIYVVICLLLLFYCFIFFCMIVLMELIVLKIQNCLQELCCGRCKKYKRFLMIWILRSFRKLKERYLFFYMKLMILNWFRFCEVFLKLLIVCFV